ncbi:MAG: hypothetical protein RIQ60_281 [Pseudomonadota bacterium]
MNLPTPALPARVLQRLARPAHHAALSWRLFLAASVALPLAALAWLQAPPVSRIDDALQDLLMVASVRSLPAHGAGAAGHTVFVDIDDLSLAAVGQWPWPRYRIASLIQHIAADGPAAIALDIVFPEADRVSLATLKSTYQQDFGLDLNFSGVPAALGDNDAYLAHTLDEAGVIGARYFYFTPTGPAATDPAAAPSTPTLPTSSTNANTDAPRLLDRAGLLRRVDVAQGVLDSVASIATHTPRTGFLNSRADADGVLRHLPLLIRHQGELQPGLGLAAALQALHARRAEVVSSRDGPVLRLTGATAAEAGQVPAPPAHAELVPDIPLDNAGQLRLRWQGDAASYARVPALALLNRSLAPGHFTGKVVFIGVSASGLHDHQRSALDTALPGTLVHATLAESILDGRHLRQPDWAPAAAALACLLAATWLTAAAGVGVGGLVAGSGLLVAGLLAASAAMYSLAGWVQPVGAPLLTVLLLFVGLLVQRGVTEQRRAARYQQELAMAREITIESMAAVAETRDPETGAHIKRTQHYVRAIAEELRRSGLHLATLTPDYIDLLFLSAPLHDIGKVGVPDRILLKPGRLDTDEMVEMKKHAEYGRHIVAGSARRLAGGDNFLTIAAEIAGTHHEKWDGSGYPLGLAGEAIPLSGRIMAVADVYDALISRRCYKEPFSHEVATQTLRDWRGSSFDPAVLDAFFRIEDHIQAIAARYRDESGDATVEAPVSSATSPSPTSATPSAPTSAPAQGQAGAATR